MARAIVPDGTIEHTLSLLRRRLAREADALVPIALAVLLLVVSVAAFLVSPPFGFVVILVLSAGLALAAPGQVSVTLLTAFLLQNLVIAAYSPHVADDQTFTAVRGVNFVVLVSAFALFLLTLVMPPRRIVAGTRPWLGWSLGVLGVILVYLLIGVARGHAADAIIYFRNTLTPLACFFIALVAASRYRTVFDRAAIWLGILAAVYGYLELTFRLDFLSLFNGDSYLQLKLTKEIQSGYWEQLLKDTGFVLRNLEDTMTTMLFNTNLLGLDMPRVFRIGGPNFHPISFAYTLAIISAWLVFQNRWLFVLLVLPLLVVVGSKGALLLLIMAVLVRFAVPLVGTRPALLLFFATTGAWLVAAILLGTRSGDYHVLGLFAGLNEFAHNPLGQGLGLGGNLSSSTTEVLNWQAAQHAGTAQVPVESAVGVMLYQMGVGAFVFFGFLAALTAACTSYYRRTRDPRFLFGTVAIASISANAVLQEEAFYAPLALGLCLLFVGFLIGDHHRRQALEPAPTPLRHRRPAS